MELAKGPNSRVPTSESKARDADPKPEVWSRQPTGARAAETSATDSGWIVQNQPTRSSCQKVVSFVVPPLGIEDPPCI